MKLKKAAARDVALDLALLKGRGAHAGRIFLVQRSADERRLAGFWELPEKKSLPGWRARASKEFMHRIVNDRFLITVWRGVWRGAPPVTLPAGRWFTFSELAAIPLTTVTRKALDVVKIHTQT